MAKHPHTEHDPDTEHEHAAAPPAATQQPAKADDTAQRYADDKKRDDERFKSDEKLRADEHVAAQQKREAAQKRAEAVKKEADRRAALSPPERMAEDEKRAAMTPEEREKDDESKGLTPAPLDEVNLLAGQSQFPILSEPHHTAEFILTEANGQRSRENAYLADPVTVYVGMPLKKTAPATNSLPATYVPAAAGADCNALAIYAGGSIPGQGLRISVIARDAEVNGNLISWGAITAPEQVIGIQTLAAQGIIVRF